MRWLDGLANSMGMSLSKLLEIVKDNQFTSKSLFSSVQFSDSIASDSM